MAVACLERGNMGRTHKRARYFNNNIHRVVFMIGQTDRLNTAWGVIARKNVDPPQSSCAQHGASWNEFDMPQHKEHFAKGTESLAAKSL